ncbi:hypothetical protein [Spongorhabdus nitratireducens]
MKLGHAQQMILAVVAAVVITVLMLDMKGYLRHSAEDDAIYLAEFNMLAATPGTEQKLSSRPADQVARCEQGFLVLEERSKHGGGAVKASGLLADKKMRPVRCTF